MTTWARTDDIDLAVEWSFQMVAIGVPSFVVFISNNNKALILQPNSEGVSVSREEDEKYLFTAKSKKELKEFLVSFK